MNNKIDNLTATDAVKLQCTAGADLIAMDIKKLIRDLSSYHGKRWKRGYWNQVGVYDVKLNIAQIQIIHRALQNINYQKHLKNHWKAMYKEVIKDYNGRVDQNYKQQNNKVDQYYEQQNN